MELIIKNVKDNYVSNCAVCDKEEPVLEGPTLLLGEQPVCRDCQCNDRLDPVMLNLIGLAEKAGIFGAALYEQECPGAGKAMREKHVAEAIEQCENRAEAEEEEEIVEVGLQAKEVAITKAVEAYYQARKEAESK